jgi:integrase
MGTRLKRALNTDSLALANRLKLKVVAEFREKIERAQELAGLKPRQVIAEALEIAEYLSVPLYGDAEEDIFRLIAKKATEILGPEIGIAHTEDGGSIPIYDSARSAAAEDFKAVATGHATPLNIHFAAYLGKSLVKARTKADDARAIKYLTDWCTANRIPATLQAINRRVAVQFMDDFVNFSGGLNPITQNKYIGRLRRYWAFMLRRFYVESNVWHDINVEVPEIPHGEEERKFTDEEVRKLLMGTSDPKLLDLMLIGALTGARLDAIVDLRVKDCIDGCFTFKPQKKERSARDIPIHPDLKTVIQRRTKGKKPEDSIFPEWPPPRKIGSMRERSFKASNAFTAYRRICGVDEVIPGKRRSLVNFHSFRRWFITKAERAGFSGDLIAAIVGHKRSGITLGRYSEGPEMQQAKACVAAVKLPPLTAKKVPEPRALTPRKR